jgi:rSAM/selenodomain-associated transferase 2
MAIASISVIIPVLNEEENLPSLLSYLYDVSDRSHLLEIIVVDGGSTDKSVEIARQNGAVVIHSLKGRARQMNAGARVAKGDVLYFLHADSYPPLNVWNTIIEAARQKDAGCFRLKFNTNSWFLKANAWFTRFNINAIRFGDQSLFVRKHVFETVGSFNETHVVLEDQEIVRRISKQHTFTVLPDYVTTSARKYEENGNVRLQCIFLLICVLYNLGFPQQKLVATYKKLIRRPNI